MKRLRATFYYLAAWLALSLLISHLWVTKPEIFPALPMPLWDWADSHFRAGNAEEIADLEFLVIFTLSSAVMLFVGIGVYSVWRRAR